MDINTEILLDVWHDIRQTLAVCIILLGLWVYPNGEEKRHLANLMKEHSEFVQDNMEKEE